jgi:hypothetical protein
MHWCREEHTINNTMSKENCNKESIFATAADNINQWNLTGKVIAKGKIFPSQELALKRFDFGPDIRYQS